MEVGSFFNEILAIGEMEMDENVLRMIEILGSKTPICKSSNFFSLNFYLFVISRKKKTRENFGTSSNPWGSFTTSLMNARRIPSYFSKFQINKRISCGERRSRESQGYHLSPLRGFVVVSFSSNVVCLVSQTCTTDTRTTMLLSNCKSFNWVTFAGFGSEIKQNSP